MVQAGEEDGGGSWGRNQGDAEAGVTRRTNRKVRFEPSLRLGRACQADWVEKCIQDSG